MNYRSLFILSIIILAVGFGGLFFLPDDQPNTPQQTTTQGEVAAEAPQSEPSQSEKVITTVTLNHDIKKGTLLQPEDYTVSELTVPENSPLVESDVKELVDSAANKSLQGFLVAENLSKGSLLNQKVLIDPEDPRFILMSIDPQQEVAYRIYIKEAERYLLDSIRGGDMVSVYSVQQDLGRPERDQNSLAKIAENFKVLKVKKFSPQQADPNNDENTKKTDTEYNKDFLGYLSLKVDAMQLKEFYSLDKQARLIVLPTTNDEATEVNHRGMFIRQLRGRN
ncbi:SAF domain-containing protein [[Haemophilus] ducreyi]|uniref:SAF domain-containing protein n=1 Tax=Haemophilus ducreyi TaxID=730 RepID=UPI000656647D|nr:SAF domain-containing protein [[Haemophilus] ducreyi]AKO45542.1 flp operon protein C [[Haemophilus] ducreyi]AKO46928.1 flp operon protein C [[Haemophilus] ducreyi]AKO48269.1 flp operon protein C [[Haemophilus] ducreyi]AKO49659.1 flp operon protein C [[Haemophilus] ducreyi]ANF62573.1 flp operon protein C [[Haemophilus] ducreyi]